MMEDDVRHDDFCKQEARIARNEVILDSHSGMLPQLAGAISAMAADLKAIKWGAIGGAVGYFAHEASILALIKTLIGA